MTLNIVYIHTFLVSCLKGWVLLQLIGRLLEEKHFQILAKDRPISSVLIKQTERSFRNHHGINGLQMEAVWDEIKGLGIMNVNYKGIRRLIHM